MYPLRWNPVEITIRPLVQVTVDVDYGERSGDDQFGDPVVLDGQPNFWKGNWQRLDPGYAGNHEVVRGHVLFRIVDLDAAGFRPSVGDAIIKIADFDQVNGDAFRCVEVRPVSPLRGGYIFLKAFVEHDRKIRGLMP